MHLGISWVTELGIAALVVAIAASLQFPVDWQDLAALLVVSAYLGWHLFQIWRLNGWLRDPKQHGRPMALGIWDMIPSEIEKIRARDKKRKKKLARMLSEYQESTGALPDATVVLGEHQRVEWWNSKAVMILGFDSKECQGRPIGELLGDPVFRAFLQAGDYGRPLQMPAPVDDSILLEVRMVPYGKGRLLLQARDISRLAQLETVRRDFVANVSHEMRTPLTVIHGYLETMLDAGDETLGPWREVIRQMQQQSSRMRRIVEDLLLLSRLESAQEVAEPEVVDVAALLTALKEEAEGLSGEQRHRILLEVEPGLKLEGNASELDSAFSNLVFNAVRYTPAGGEVKMRWWLGADGPRLAVSDTGIGIEAKHLSRLTERFYRVDVGRSRKSGGTGLGLAIVKHVLLRHDARLEIESVPREGSTFTCHFPASRVPKPAARKAS